MFDWSAAADALLRISRTHLARFLARPEAGDVYAVGFFCDAHVGTIYLVANTEEYHRRTLGEFEARFGLTDPNVFRWDAGNWEYPGGLFPSAGPEQAAFDAAWAEFGGPLAGLEDAEKQERLEGVCVRVLAALAAEGAFAAAPGLAGVTVLGPDDRREDTPGKWRPLDRLV